MEAHFAQNRPICAQRLLPSFTSKSAWLSPALFCRRAFIGQCEVDLLLELVNARDEDAQLIADCEPVARSAADQAALRGVEEIEVVIEGRNVNDTGDEHIRQLPDQAVVSDIDNRRAENLRVARVELALEELQFFHPGRLDLSFGGVAFRFGNVLCDRSDSVDVSL